MVTLYKFPRVWGLPCMSPFCMKVEAYLRLRGITHEVRMGDLRRAPRGQLPWVQDGGHAIGDSTLIIDHFEARQAEPLDGWLDDRQRASGWALARTLEESTVWALRHQRFAEPAAWPHTREVVRGILPAPLRSFGPAIVRRQMIGALRAQGQGRFDAATLYAFAIRDFEAAAALLGDEPYLFGGQPSRFDLTLFGFVASFSAETCRSPVTERLLTLPSLLAHHDRLRRRLYPEIADWVAQPRAQPPGHAAAEVPALAA
ncbi:MAG: glutathione S-transferase family protein [Rubrivivax sp.]|nr:glutathione S-transferase family protein [Rubrivivax sp.]